MRTSKPGGQGRRDDSAQGLVLDANIEPHEQRRELMKDAHERFGRLVYRRHTEKTATNLRVLLDGFVGEDRGKAHLVSVVGGDVEIGALAAAFANGDSFTVEDPHGAESIVSLGEKPLCFRGSIVVSRPEKTAETSCGLLAGISGQCRGREAAFGERRPPFRLVVPGMSLRSASYARLGLLGNRAIGAAEEDSTSLWIWIRRCSDKSDTQTPTSTAVEGAEEQADRFPRPEWTGRMACHPTDAKTNWIRTAARRSECCMTNLRFSPTGQYRSTWQRIDDDQISRSTLAR